MPIKWCSSIFVRANRRMFCGNCSPQPVVLRISFVHGLVATLSAPLVQWHFSSLATLSSPSCSSAAGGVMHFYVISASKFNNFIPAFPLGWSNASISSPFLVSNSFPHFWPRISLDAHCLDWFIQLILVNRISRYLWPWAPGPLVSGLRRILEFHVICQLSSYNNP